MITGPRRPDESRDDYIARVLDSATPLTPENVRLLAPLLRLGNHGQTAVRRERGGPA